jgi:methyl-accepting chemotaxis protein
MTEANKNGSFSDDCSVDDILRHWLTLSETNRVVFSALLQEVSKVTQLSEKSVGELTGKFMEMSLLSSRQANRTEHFAETASVILVDEEFVSLEDAFETLAMKLSIVADQVLSLSRRGIEVGYNLQEAESEIEELSALVNDLATPENQDHISKIMQKVDSLQKRNTENSKHIQAMSSMDMSEKLRVKERLDQISAGLLLKNQETTETLSETAQETQIISEMIQQIIVGMQYQDRASQSLQSIHDTLTAIDQLESGNQQKVSEKVGSSDPEKLASQVIDTYLDPLPIDKRRKEFIKCVFEGKYDEYATDDAATLNMDKEQHGNVNYVAGNVDLDEFELF